MKNCAKIVLFILLPLYTSAQNASLDSLRNVFATATVDSIRYNTCRKIYDYYEEANRDSGFLYANKCLELAQKNGKRLAEAFSLDNKAYQLLGLGRYAESLQYLLDALKITEDPANENEKSWHLFSNAFNTNFTGSNRLLVLSYTHHMLGVLMWQTDNNEQAILHFGEARRISSEIGHNTRFMMANMNLGRSYLMINQLDSAMMREKEAEQMTFKTGFKKYLGQVYTIMGGIFYKRNDTMQARNYYNMAAAIAKEQNNLNTVSASYFLLTRLYLDRGRKDSALYYAMENLDVIRHLGPVSGLTVNLGTVYENIYLCYKGLNQRDSLFKYQGLTLAVKDSLYKIRIKSLTQFQTVTLNEQLRLKNAEKEKIAWQNKVRTLAMLGGLAIFLLIALILYRNNKQKQKTNKVLEQTLADLKSTQKQLIQSEKMASLGELTAGIAHEIQNPLNFINNFSEINKELLIEMKEELDKGQINEAKSLANDVIDNEGKIVFHGKRADGIVKGMLQHSRSSNGQKESTDINALCDEYLRLSYHGLRAKDKSFNATMKTDFANSVGKLNVIPQDIGRVILNLLTNAFYIVNEKSKMNIPGYAPTVIVSTKKINGKVEIRVTDNGNGIPPRVLDKIFQPFFTTKPTGQGTGLGLSLSYDIIAKGHSGELKVETKEGEGSSFIIVLPL